jgi:hypothetical protein
VTATAVGAAETAAAMKAAAMKAARACSTARSESLGHPSMVEAAECARVCPGMEASAPTKSTRMKPAGTSTVSEAALVTKPTGSTVAPESRAVRMVR